MPVTILTPHEITENVGKKIRVDYKRIDAKEGFITYTVEGHYTLDGMFRLFENESDPHDGFWSGIDMVRLIEEEEKEPLADWERELMDSDRIQRLEEQVRDLNATVERKDNALEVIRRRHHEQLVKIGEKAMELGERHGWCDVVEEGLVEMGVPVPSRKFVVEMTVRVEVEGSRHFARYVDERNGECIAETFQITHDEDVENMARPTIEVTSVEKVD